MMNKYFISTAIPYVNSSPHLGFALELAQADVLARYHRMKGEDVWFMTGTDENALKNVQAAEKAGAEIKKFVDEHAEKFRKLTKTLQISNNDFLRTTEERHIRGAQQLWKSCKSEDIYRKNYKGLYCIGCEEFKTSKDLVDGFCPEHKVRPEKIEEENFFFKLSKYEKELQRLVESDELKITPSFRKKETLEFIKSGLEDFSISRSCQRAKNWGVPVPGDGSQIFYVWFDALTCYINSLGYGSKDVRFEEFWQKGYVAHLVGKGITRFHAIYWSAMLLSAGLALPKEIFVHGYLTVDGEKISKSLGNVIDPFEVVKKYGTDAVRYFLLREIPSGEDGNFSYKKLEERYDGDLANGLGNLVQRAVTLIENNLGGELVFKRDKLKNIIDNKKNYKKAIEDFRLHDALGEIWKLISETNQYIDERKPWKESEENPEGFLETMTTIVALIHHISWLLQPFMPETVQKISVVFGDNLENTDIPENYKFLVKKGDPLFPRLN